MPQQPPQPSRYRGADSSERGYQRVRVRQDTAANWQKNDPVLASGEFGYVIGAQNPDAMLKCGDGTVPWSRLPYLLQTGHPGPPGQDGHGITVYGPSDRPPSPTNTALFDGDVWLSSTPGYSGTPDFDAAIVTPGAQGPKGDAASIVVGVVSALPPGTTPVVRNVGTQYAAVFDFQIPQGGKGDQGLIGPDGPAGPKGPAGDTFKVSGAVANAAALPAAPPNLAVYITQDDSHLHIYDKASAAAAASGYVDLGAIAGPTGASSFFSNPVADATKLPATGADGQSVIALDTGHMHSWDAAKNVWVDAGKIVGPPGPVTGYDPATVQGAMLAWDIRANTYLPTATVPTLVPDGAADFDMLQWDAANSEWTSARPLLSHLGDVDENSTNLMEDCVLVWDVANQEWTDSRSIAIDDITFDASGPGTLLEGFGAYSDEAMNPTRDNWAPSCMAVAKYITEDVFLENLGDCKELATATDGQVPVWSDANNRWEPADQSSAASPIIYLGTGAWVAADVADSAKRHGMAADTIPSPADYPPLPGDQYIDLTTGTVTAFTGTPGAKVPTTRTMAAVTGGVQPGLDALIEDLGGLSDVTLSVPADKQVLQYELTSKQWKNVTPDYLNPTNGYTKTEVDGKLAAVTTGMVHGQSVVAIKNTPPTSPDTFSTYIAGTAPTGAWAGHPNQLAEWSGTAWTFEAPQSGESHLVEDVSETWHWTGTAWVKVAAASTGAVAAGDLWMVGAVQQSVLSEPQFKSLLSPAEQHKWALADGRDVTGSVYATTTGRNTIPDLRGAYLRMAGLNNSNAAWNGGTLNDYQEDNTSRPKSTFTGVTSSNGAHYHASGGVVWPGGSHYGTIAAGSSKQLANFDGWSDQTPRTSSAGAHTHTVTINGGGDGETRPKSYAVNYFIKIN